MKEDTGQFPWHSAVTSLTGTSQLWEGGGVEGASEMLASDSLTDKGLGSWHQVIKKTQEKQGRRKRGEIGMTAREEAEKKREGERARAQRTGKTAAASKEGAGG